MLFLFLFYIAVSGALYYLADKKGLVTIEGFEDKVGLSVIVLLWPLIAFSFAPWALAKGITFIEKMADKKKSDEG